MECDGLQKFMAATGTCMLRDPKCPALIMITLWKTEREGEGDQDPLLTGREFECCIGLLKGH